MNSGLRPAIVAMALGVVWLGSAVPAMGARLATSQEAKALRSAFLRETGHRGATITAITVSTAAPGWAAVAYVPARRRLSAASARGPEKITVLREMYRDQPASHPKPAKKPPPKAKTDLDKDTFVDITYEGEGEEHLTAHQVDTQSCGGPTMTTNVTIDVKPIKWKQVFRIDLDKVSGLIAPESGQSFVDVPATYAMSPSTDSSVVDARMQDSTDCSGAETHARCALTFEGTHGSSAVSFVSAGTRLMPGFRLTNNGCARAPGQLGAALAGWLGGLQVGVPLHFVGGILEDLSPQPATYRHNALSHPDPCQSFAGSWQSCTDSFDFSGTVSVHCCPGPPPPSKDVIRRRVP